MIKIIAELCQNHNGEIETLKKMLKAVANTGATHVKIQNIYAENLSFRPQFETGLSDNNNIKSIKRPYATEYKRLKKLELTKKEIEKFISLSNDFNLTPITTCFSRDNIQEIKKQGFKSIKVASYDCASFQMLRELKENFDEIIVSTGATYDDEIILASEILKDSDFSFLHCITIYPTPLEKLNLLRMNWLKKFSGKVGFSDHTLVRENDIKASKLALAFGATIIERHFTILEEDMTKDGPVSINEQQLKELVEFSKLENSQQMKEINSWDIDLKKIMGNEVRSLSDEEILNRDYYRGRFASKRYKKNKPENMIFNWEEIKIK